MAQRTVLQVNVPQVEQHLCCWVCNVEDPVMVFTRLGRRGQTSLSCASSLQASTEFIHIKCICITCLYMYICAYIYINMHIYVNMHIQLHTYIHIYTHIHLSYVKQNRAIKRRKKTKPTHTYPYHHHHVPTGKILSQVSEKCHLTLRNL